MSAAPLRYVLAAHMSCCRVSERHVFLDRIGDRYLTVPVRYEASLTRLLAREALIGDDCDLLQRLVDEGLLATASDTVSWAPPPVPPAPTTAILPTYCSASMWDQIDLTRRVAFARWHLRRDGLAAALDRIGRRRSRVMPASQSAQFLQTAADLLAQITLMATRHDRCLPVSLGLADYLLTRGIDCTVVFGVQLGPFQAHCWVQQGACLIGDDPDLVRTFTPILGV